MAFELGQDSRTFVVRLIHFKQPIIRAQLWKILYLRPDIVLDLKCGIWEWIEALKDQKYLVERKEGLTLTKNASEAIKNITTNLIEEVIASLSKPKPHDEPTGKSNSKPKTSSDVSTTTR